jgi:GAF domain-containing protein
VESEARHRASQAKLNDIINRAIAAIASFRVFSTTDIEDIYTSNRKPCHIEMLARFQVRANLLIPLLQRDKLWGLLMIHDCTASRDWQEWEIQLLKQLATQLAIAIEQAELHQRLKTLNQELLRAETFKLFDMAKTISWSNSPAEAPTK